MTPDARKPEAKKTQKPRRDPREVEREIERTRAQLAATIDAITDRVSPRNVARRGAARLREGAGQLWQSASSLLSPDGLVRGESRAVEPPEGLAGQDMRTTTYLTRRVRPEVVLAAAGIAVAAVGVYVLWRRRRR